MKKIKKQDLIDWLVNEMNDCGFTNYKGFKVSIDEFEREISKRTLIQLRNDVYDHSAEGQSFVESFEPEGTYNIRKSYEGKPSRNGIESKGLTLDQAVAELDRNERLWERNGGLVVKRTDTTLICEEQDSSEVITWEIEEVEIWHGVN